MTDCSDYMFTYAVLSLLQGAGTVHHALLFFLITEE